MTRLSHRMMSFSLRAPTGLPLLLLTLLATSLLLATAAPVPSSAPITETELIAVDLGHENMKISAWRVQEEDVYIKPGGTGTVTTTTTSLSGSVTMVLNDQTNRKSPPCVAFRYFKAPAGSVIEDNGPNASDDAAEGNLLYPAGYQLERTFAEQAQALAPRFPTQVICSPAQLLGYTLLNTSTHSLSTTASTSPYELTEDQLAAAYSYRVASLQQQQRDTTSGLVARDALGVFLPFFATSTTQSAKDGALFSAEELTAMLLGYARRMAEKADAVDNALSEDDERHLLELLNSTGDAASLSGGGLLRNHAVPRYAALAVPIHATVAQRQALLDAAALAGLRVVRLVHSTTGAAVQLAYMKAEQVFVTDKPHYVMLYDMGSQQAEVAIYSFTAMPSNVAKRVQYAGSVELKALVASRTLGGSAFDECIAAQWDDLYFGHRVLSGVGHATTEAERRTAAKARGSLLRAAHKAKETLSVNQEAHVTLDGLHADPALFSSAAQRQQQRDPRAVSVTADGLLSLRYPRSAFEQECRALFDAAVTLRDDAIAATNGLVAHVSALDRFEVIGGGTRVPLLLQRLSEGYRADGSLVDRTLNSDEAAVLGTTLLSVSTAPRALQMRGAQTLPHYRVREWLTNAVYMSVVLGEESGGVGDAADAQTAPSEKTQLRLLFPASGTVVPSTRSVRVKLHPSADDDDGNNAVGGGLQRSVTFTLYSGAEVDKAFRSGVSAREGVAGNASMQIYDAVVDVPASTAACASCFARAYVVDGVGKAQDTLKAQLQQQYVGGAVVLESAEVVAEAVATVSGIPHCTEAYLRAVYHITPASTTATTTTLPEGGDGMRGAPAEGEKAAKDVPTEAPAGDTEETDGEDIRNEAPQQQGTAVSATPQAASGIVEVRVIALPLRSSTSVATTAGPSSSVLRGYNMGRGELLRSRRRVRRLLAIDDVRLHRSTLRNDIESVLVWMKEQALWDGGADDAPAEAVPGLDAGWRETVKRVDEWLDDYGETADVAALEERLSLMRSIKQALKAKQSNG